MKFAAFAVALLMVASFAAAQQGVLSPAKDQTGAPAGTTILGNPSACTAPSCAPAPAAAAAPAAPAAPSNMKPAIVLGAPTGCNCQVVNPAPACGCPAPQPVYVAPEIKDTAPTCCSKSPCAANVPACPAVHIAPEIKDSSLPSSCCSVSPCGVQLRCGAPVATVVPEIGPVTVAPEIKDKLQLTPACPCAAAAAPSQYFAAVSITPAEAAARASCPCAFSLPANRQMVQVA